MPMATREDRDVSPRKLTPIDARDKAVRRRVARSSARLSPESERDAMDWIEAVSIFDDRRED